MRRFIRAIPLVALAVALWSAPTHAQAPRVIRLPAPTASVELSGPRVGFTYLPSGTRERLADRDIEVGSMIAQFGWQFERQFVGAGDAVSPIMEMVVLVGGLDQGVLLPSVSWIVGVRSRTGFELGVGPNATPAGVALAFAAGAVIRQPSLDIPLSVAAVPSAHGVRVSLLTGFTMR